MLDIQKHRDLLSRATEEWRPIPSWEGYYEVSNFGRIRSLDRKVRKNSHIVKGKILVPSISKRNRYRVNLCRNDERKGYYVHRLVAQVFIGEPPTKKHEVNHKDGNPANNHVENIEWVTRSENLLHSYAHGLHKKKFGTKNCKNKLSIQNIRDIRSKTHITGMEFARKLNVSSTTIYNIRSRKIWSHII